MRFYPLILFFRVREIGFNCRFCGSGYEIGWADCKWLVGLKVMDWCDFEVKEVKISENKKKLMGLLR